MAVSRARGRLGIGASAAIIGSCTLLLASPSQAGSGANFVTYNHHMAEQGEKEISLYSDFSYAGVEDGYSAQLLELEYGVTDLWTASLYFEGVAADGEPYEFGGWRFENRVRLFKQDVLFNPVLYVEYEQLEPEHRYKRAVTGRTDAHEEEGEDEETEHELETKLLLGQDLSKRLDVAFNWINEVNFDSGKWEFGYATGINYVLFDDDDLVSTASCGLEEVKLGLEMYGGLGDSDDGLTFNWNKTEQYAGINLSGEFKGGVELGVGVALGLTDDSEDAIVRTRLSYEFK